MGKPTAEQLAKINQFALVPMTEDDVYVFPAKVLGTNVIPKYKMRIMPNFLTKMADQVRAGIALLIDHPWMSYGEQKSIPYGRTFDAKIQQDGGELSLYADHYMRLGQEFDDISTDQLAAGIDAGTIFDTSAGWITTDHKCSICKNDYYSSNCTHMRGGVYDGQECIVEANDGFLMENSLVFDGGYEGAGIRKQGLSSAKPEDPSKQIQYEELALDAKSLPGDGSVFYVLSKNGATAYVPKHSTSTAGKTAEGDEPVTEQEKQAQEQALQQTQAALTQATGLIGQIKTALSITADGDILTKISSLSALAAVGEQYKVKVTEEACGAGVRALGEAFNVDAMKLSFANLSVTEIEKVRDTYEAQAKALFPNGRQTQGAGVDLPAGAADGTPPANPQANGGQQTPEQLRAKAQEEAVAALKRTGNANLVKEAK
jgi:hypothetical protein